MGNELITVRRLIADDAHALTFQTFGQYRTALLKAVDAALTAPVATEQAQAETGEANMFWNDADPERSADSIHEVIEREWSDGLLQIGDVIEIQRATRLSNIKVEIVPDPKDEDGFDYEIMPAHLKAEPVQQDAPAPSMVGDAKGGA